MWWTNGMRNFEFKEQPNNLEQWQRQQKKKENKTGTAGSEKQQLLLNTNLLNIKWNQTQFCHLVFF